MALNIWPLLPYIVLHVEYVHHNHAHTHSLSLSKKEMRLYQFLSFLIDSYYCICILFQRQLASRKQVLETIKNKSSIVSFPFIPSRPLLFCLISYSLPYIWDLVFSLWFERTSNILINIGSTLFYPCLDQSVHTFDTQFQYNFKLWPSIYHKGRVFLYIYSTFR